MKYSHFYRNPTLSGLFPYADFTMFSIDQQNAAWFETDFRVRCASISITKTQSVLPGNVTPGF